MKLVSLSSLSNQALDERLAVSIANHRVSAVELLQLLAESDRRKRFAELGYSSTFEYCVRAFNMSEGAAYKKIRAARAARRFPVILEMLADGRLNLSVVVVLASKLTEHLAAELVDAAVGKTRTEVEVLIAARFPQPDLREFVRPVAIAAPTLPPTKATQLSPGTVVPCTPMESTQLMGPLLTLPTSAEPITRITPRAPGRFALQVMLSEAAHDDLRALRELLGHRVPSGELSEVLERVLGIARRVIEKQKYAATTAPRAGHGSDNQRYIPAEIKRQVCERDGNRCAFVSASGKRCESRMRLEFDHRLPIADGGETCVQNVRLLCRAHNLFEAERVMGEQRVKRARDVAMQQRAREGTAVRGRGQLPA